MPNVEALSMVAGIVWIWLLSALKMGTMPENQKELFNISPLEQNASNSKRCLDTNAILVCDKTKFYVAKVFGIEFQWRTKLVPYLTFLFPSEMFWYFFWRLFLKFLIFIEDFNSLKVVLFKDLFTFQASLKKYVFFHQKKGSRKNPKKINNNLTRFVFRSIKWLIWLTYCPSNVIGGVTCQCWNALLLLTSTIHSWMSGFFDPGVGYRIVRVSGNDVLPKLCTAIRLPESNHGYTIVPTSVSLNDIYIICDPSSELQIASGVAKTSSAHPFSPAIKKIKRKDEINKLIFINKNKNRKEKSNANRFSMNNAVDVKSHWTLTNSMCFVH